MVSLARRNLFYDKVRLAVTLTGVIFAVALVAVQVGLFIGFTRITTNIIDNSKADLWVASKGIQHLEVGVPFSERKLYQILETPGVAKAEKYIVQFGFWRRLDGASETVEIVGFNPDSELGRPWNIVEGSIRDLQTDDTIMIDILYRGKLGITQLGQVVEIQQHRARVVGFTQGIRTFTTSPVVFTSFKNALCYQRLGEDQTYFILVKATAGVDLQDMKRRLLARLQDVDILTTEEFAHKNMIYWVFGTGAGVTVLIAAVLGLIVGIVVVAQTIYAATIDHLREFGTLKAMGASNGYLYRVVIKQAAISAIIGYVVGIIISLVAVHMSKSASVAIILPWEVGASLFFLTLFMCMSAAMVSINKLTRIDPAMVFKG